MDRVARKTYWQIFWRWGYWVPAFWILALFALIFYLVFFFQAHQMDRVAVRTNATITEKNISVDVHILRRETHYGVSYSYRDLTGQTVSRSDEVWPDFYNSVSVGRAVPFRYDPKNPGHYEIVPGQMAHLANFNLAQAGFLFGCGAWIAWLSNLWVNHAIRVRDTGALRSAVIIGIEWVVRGRLYYSRALWRDEAGELGQTWVRPSEYTLTPSSYLPAVGSTITIYADPSGKLPSVWEGDCGSR